MKPIFTVILLFIFQISFSQQIFPTTTKSEKVEEPKYMIELNEAVVVESRVFTNDTTRYNYNQLKHYVKMILPYVDAAVKLFNEIDVTTNNMSKKERRRYIKSKESEIKTTFEDKLSSLNITQGRLLVKIVNRQLNMNCYEIVKELKNPITAAYYQSWAKLNGINLNETYIAENNKELERVLRNLGY